MDVQFMISQRVQSFQLIATIVSTSGSGYFNSISQIDTFADQPPTKRNSSKVPMIGKCCPLIVLHYPYEKLRQYHLHKHFLCFVPIIEFYSRK